MLNPYENINDLKTFKGELHFHSTRSDGKCTPEEMFERLKECEFNFCSLTDHDLPCEETHQYKNLLVLMGQEMSAETGHIVALLSKVTREEQWFTAQQLKAISASGGFAILSHPKIREFTKEQGLTYTAERLICEFPGLYDGIEIYTHNLARRGSGSGLAIDRLDVVWSAMVFPWGAFVKKAFKPVWGFATSDIHHVNYISENVGIMVWAQELSEKSLLDSIRKGAFYSLANTKTRFPEISLNENTLYVCATDAIMISVIKAGGMPIKVISRNAAGSMSIKYPIRGDEGYVRVEAMDSDGHCAYTNPIFLGALSLEQLPE